MNAKTLIKHGYVAQKNIPDSKLSIFHIVETKKPLDSKIFIKKIPYNIQQLSDETKEFYGIPEDENEIKHLEFKYDIDYKEIRIGYFSPNDDLDECYNIKKLEEIEQIYKSELTGKVKEYDMSYIYLIKSSFGYKIGKANDPFSRFSMIQTSNPEKLEIVHLFPVEEKYAHEIEKKYHKIFKDKRIIGEWFKLDDTDIFIMEALYHSNYIYSKLADKKIEPAVKIYNIILENYTV